MGLSNQKQNKPTMPPCPHNNIDCPCTKEGCPRHGKCCECVAHHKEHGKNQLDEFNVLYKALADKMLPMVYELGFLK